MSNQRTESETQPVEAILSAAGRLFANKGYDAASMREIAEAANVAKPTIYYYFHNKEGLFEALLERAISSFCESLAAISARPRGTDAKGCLEDAVLASFEHVWKHANLNRFIHSLVFSPPLRPERQLIDKAFSRVAEEFQNVLGRAADEGLMEHARIPEAALALRGCTMVHIVQALHGHVVLSKDIASGIVDGFLYGYGKRTGAQAIGEST